MSLQLSTPAPLFAARSPRNPRFAFSSLGGHWVLLAFLPPPGPAQAAALQQVEAHQALFLRQDGRCLFLGVLPDLASFERAREIPPGLSWLEDADGRVRNLYAATDASGAVTPTLVLIDPSQRIFRTAPLAALPAMLETVAALPDPGEHAGVPLHAPVLIVPRVFEPAMCERLIAHYHAHGGVVSGVMRERDGKTVPVIDNFKKRRDAAITDAALQAEIRARISRRLLPEVHKAYQFEATRIERYIVARYDAAEGGYFRPHRDNTTAGTAHRRFAVSINLNADQFDGGDLRFPEFGARTYRPPTGGAVVFSCSLLHEATPVTRGERFAFLPFLYDDAGARLREANRHLLATEPAAE